MAEPDDELESSDINASTNELLAFQRDLKQEKELLEKILTKVDNQIHSLQVEQLHLLGNINKSLRVINDDSGSHSTNDNNEDLTNKSLDLSVASAFKYFEEEIEDESDS